MQYENSISMQVYGRYALFSDPITRVGGEKFSYPVPTYQALKGIYESCYWKPTFTWVIDELRVMNPIERQSKGIRPIMYNNGKNDLSIYTYLSDVCYQVRAHFEWNEHRPDLEKDRNENKHYAIAKRMLERGGRRDIFLGTRECQGYIEGVMQERFWHPVMQNGKICFCRPEECEIVRDIHPQKIKTFTLGETVSDCDDLYREVIQK